MRAVICTHSMIIAADKRQRSAAFLTRCCNHQRTMVDTLPVSQRALASASNRSVMLAGVVTVYAEFQFLKQHLHMDVSPHAQLFESVWFRSPVLHLHVGNHWDAEGRYCRSQQVGGRRAAYKHTHRTRSCSLHMKNRAARSYKPVFVVPGTTAWQPWFITASG